MTAAVTVVLAFLPGGLLAFAVPAGRLRWVGFAAAPALTLGLAGAAMTWLPWLRLPSGAGAVLVAELAVAAAAVLAARPGRRRAGDPDGGERRPQPSPAAWRLRVPRSDLLGVAVPATVAILVGWVLLGRLVAPPGWDAMNHGILTRRILEAGSVAITSACSTGSTDPGVSCRFYPLAADVVWAQAVLLTGGGVGAAMTAWAIVVGPVALVAGVYAGVRVLGGGPVVAGAAAAAPAFLGTMWTPMLIGRVTEQTGPCLAGGVAVLVALALRGRHPLRAGVLAGLACAGLALTHTYDLLFVGVLALGLVALLRVPFRWARALAASAALAATTVAAMLPMLGALLTANDERTSSPPDPPGRYLDAFHHWVTQPGRYVLFGHPRPGRDDPFDLSAVHVALALTLLCLLAAPLCLVLRDLRWARPWLAAAALFTALGVWTMSSGSAPAMLVASFWYGNPVRLRNMISPVYGVLAVAGAVAIALVLARLRAALARRAQAVQGVAAAALVVALAGLAALPESWRPLRVALARRAPVGPAYVDAFRWLDRNTPPGSVVAYDRHMEFMTWSYADHGTPLLFGIAPLPSGDRDNYAARWRAWNWVVASPGAPPAGCEVRRFGVAFVAVGERHMPGATRFHYTRERLDRTDRLELAHRAGGIRIYRVTDAGRSC
jgi:hypothetical protein